MPGYKDLHHKRAVTTGMVKGYDKIPDYDLTSRDEHPYSSHVGGDFVGKFSSKKHAYAAAINHISSQGYGPDADIKIKHKNKLVHVDDGSQ